MSETKSLTLDEAKAQVRQLIAQEDAKPVQDKDESFIDGLVSAMQTFSRVEQPSEEDRGWQDQDSKPPEFVEVKGVESATFDQDQEADGVEWHVGSEWAIVNGHTIAIECGQVLFTWVVFQDGEQGVTARSNPVTPPHTLAEARRQAVEAARGMG